MGVKNKPSAPGGLMAKRSVSRESALSNLSNKIKATSEENQKTIQAIKEKIMMKSINKNKLNAIPNSRQSNSQKSRGSV